MGVHAQKYIIPELVDTFGVQGYNQDTLQERKNENIAITRHTTS
jgi:hypothetical protein